MNKPLPDYPRFIKNQADGEDRFPEKGQEKVAKAISGLIAGKEQKSKIIGLEGEWGAGKSNVIRMVKNNLIESHHVYIHDVWSYQEDLQRRAFLESLTIDLSKSHDGKAPFVTDSTKWDENLKKLLAKKKESIVDTIPSFSPGFLFVLVCIFLWSILKDFAGPITILWGGEIHPNFWVVVVAILGYLAFSYKKGKLLGPKDIFYLYNEKDTKKVTNETIFEDEPSVERFQKWIIDIQQDFPKEKELIVVFDNMDRLPREKVKQIWSLIHTFFNEICFAKIWVIVPYSRDQLARAFDQPDDTDHFIDKTFTIQYQVPPPILTDWKRFFTEVYIEAFGQGQEDELSIVQSTFDRLNEKITPRKIIIFFNEMVALKKIWDNEIKLRYIALYALRKRIILNNPTEEILNRNFLGKAEPLFVNDEDLLDNISALVYNIPVKSAAQIALKQELRVILRNGDKLKIKDFVQLPFFIELLESIVAEDGKETNGFEAVLDSIDKDSYDTLDQRRMLAIWRTIGDNYWTRRESDQKFTEADKILLRRIPEYKKQNFLDNLIKNLDYIGEDKFSGKNYYDALKAMEEFLKKNGLENLKVTPILNNYKKRPEVFLDYLKAVSTNNDDYKVYRLTADSKELNAYLIPKSLDDIVPLQCLTQLHGDVQFDLSEFKAKLKERIDGEEINISNVGTAVEIYRSLLTEERVDSFLPIHRIDEFLPSLTNEKAGFKDLLAMRLKFMTSDPAPVKYVNRLANESNIPIMAGYITCYMTEQDVFDAVINHDNPFLNSIIRHWVMNTSDTVNAELNLPGIIPHIEGLCSKINVQPLEFLTFLNKCDPTSIESIATDRIESIIPNVAVLQHIINVDNELCQHLLAVLKERFDTMNEDEWLVNFSNTESFAFSALCIFLENDKIISSPSESAFRGYRQALFNFAIGDFSLTPEGIAKWNLVYSKVDRSHLLAPLKEIRDRFISPENPSVTPDQYKLFGNMFVDLKILSDHFGAVCRRILAPVITDTAVLNSHILVHQDYYYQVISNAGTEADMLIENLRNMSKANPENVTLKEFIESLDK